MRLVFVLFDYFLVLSNVRFYISKGNINSDFILLYVLFLYINRTVKILKRFIFIFILA